VFFSNLKCDLSVSGGYLHLDKTSMYKNRDFVVPVNVFTMLCAPISWATWHTAVCLDVCVSMCVCLHACTCVCMRGYLYAYVCEGVCNVHVLFIYRISTCFLREGQAILHIWCCAILRYRFTSVYCFTFVIANQWRSEALWLPIPWPRANEVKLKRGQR